MSQVDDARCARALGWELQGDSIPMWYGIDGHVLTLPYLLIGAIPEFSGEEEGRMFAYLLEDEIERRGLRDAYVTELGNKDIWRFTPTQIVAAFLKAVEDQPSR